MTDRQPQADDARRLLLEGLIDYAGLFPPAALTMADAVAKYGEYRRGPHAWALGKFVVPVARLEEFERAVASLPDGGAWPLALVAGPDFGADARAVALFAARAAPRATVGAIEVKASTAGRVVDVAGHVAWLQARLATEFDAYVEVPVASDPAPLIESIARYGLRAKVRTGGVEPGAFPSTDEVARFLAACRAHGVTFKATAGLHHALRGTYPFTYEPSSERGTMFGFLNVFLAALFVGDGLDPADARALLEERDASNIAFAESGVTWRGRTVAADSVRRMRAAAVSFGSCSFVEPVADLSSLGLL